MAGTASDALIGLGRAVAADPAWAGLADGQRVVRPHGRPALGVFGDFDAARIARLEALVVQAPGPRPAEAVGPGALLPVEGTDRCGQYGDRKVFPP